MAKITYDGVVEAVRYQSDGQVKWVRAYERRGPTFSDIVLIERKDLIARLKAGKRYLVGQRIEFLAGSFNVGAAIRVVQQDGREVLVVGDDPAMQDRLTGVPIL